MLVQPNKENNKIDGLSVNGELLTAYSVPHGQNITVTGIVKDLLNALNAEFYAAHWGRMTGCKKVFLFFTLSEVECNDNCTYIT